MFDDSMLLNFDNVPGYRLVDYKRVGLPVYFAHIDVLFEERCDLHLIDEYCLRLVKAGVNVIDDIVSLLGVSSVVVQTSLADLIVRKAIKGDGNGVSILPDGVELLAVRGEMVCKEGIWIVPFDAVLKRPFRWNHRILLTSGDLRASGHGIEVGTFTAKPASTDLDVNEVFQVVQSMRIDKELDRLVEIRHVRRAPLRFVPVLQLAYLGARDSVQSSFVFDGRRLDQHSDAFGANNGLMRPAFRELRAGVSEGAQGRAKARRRLLRLPSNVGDSPISVGNETTSRVRDAPVYEVSKSLRDGLRSCTARLIFTTESISPLVANDEFFRELTETLARGISVFVGIGPGVGQLSLDGSSPSKASSILKQLGSQFEKLVLWSIGNWVHSHLIVDDTCMIVGQYDWLAPDGSMDRHFRERWFLTTFDSAVITTEVERLLDSIPAKPGSNPGSE